MTRSVERPVERFLRSNNKMSRHYSWRDAPRFIKTILEGAHEEQFWFVDALRPLLHGPGETIANSLDDAENLDGVAP